MLVNDSLDEVKKRENALSIIKDWVLNKSRDSLYDLTGLSGGFIANPSELNLLETYVGPAIFEEELQKVGIEHMGGEKVLPLNRTSSGILATILALVSKNSNVVHYLEVLRDTIGFDNLKAKVVNPLKGKKIGAYYGCLLLRPGKVMSFDNPENPTIIEDFIRAIGAEPVVYPYRNECCGGYISLKEKDMAKSMCDKICESAKGFGADMLITACPLCMYNLNKSTEAELPVYYFTELLAEALGVKEEVTVSES